jgi:hypothetical protein
VTTAKLLDFGLAKLVRHGERPALVSETHVVTEAAPDTARGTILGTLQYMAPEQLEGRDADARTDLWALGAILYEMVTGRRAFEGDSQVSLIGNIMNAEPAGLATLQPLTPPALERVVRKCLAKAPDDRWDTAHDVADELRWIASNLSAPAAAPAAARHSRRVSLLWWLPTAGLLIALAIALPAALRQWRATPPSPALVRFTIFPLENTTFPAAGGAAEGHRRRARHPDRACRAARSRDHPRDARVARGCALAERPAARVRGRTGPRAAVTWCLHATATRTRVARDDQIAGRWPVRHWRRFPAGSQDPSSKD